MAFWSRRAPFPSCVRVRGDKSKTGARRGRRGTVSGGMARAGARCTAAVGLALRLLLGLGLGLEAAATPAWSLTPTSAVPSLQAADPSTGSCPSASFQCRTGGVCVPFAWRCDRDRDCLDGSDEDECRIEPPGVEPSPPTGCLGGQGKSPHNCSPRPCPAGELRCALGGACIPRTWRCDGHPDCPDSSDERGCAIDYLRLIAGTPETLQGRDNLDVTLESVSYVSSAEDQDLGQNNMVPTVTLESVSYFSSADGQDSGQSENQSALGVIAAAAVLSAALAAAALLALCQLVGPGRHFKESLLLSESKAFLL
ncbi:PREDICTED: CD320 antigen [Chrysochloris asiatica]|uniref:CD320 antigen n=1 Tax=Chrysochloris asiatica TaxID=185453 RepID=A0A9B0TQI9_CHRAS|nr:PREDICTED: CD320 antigen [Chrysochloris asiatica]